MPIRAQKSSYRLPLLWHWPLRVRTCGGTESRVQGTDGAARCGLWHVQLKARDNYGPGRISAVTMAN
jgi:hypothetical protein